jgi:hypothetical protein
MRWRSVQWPQKTGSKNENTNINVSSLLRLIHRMDLGDISEVHFASIFKVEVCRFLIFCICITQHLSRWALRRVTVWEPQLSIGFLVDTWGLKRAVYVTIPTHCPYWPIRRTNSHSTPASPFNVAFQNTMLYIYIYTEKLNNPHNSIPKMETACTSETSAISSTSTGCYNLRTELTSIIKHHESLKSERKLLQVQNISELENFSSAM